MEITTRDVQVRICIEDSASSYNFRCPHCRMAVVKSAEPRVVDLLVASGVELTAWSLPAELFEPHPDLPLTHDDLLDFHDMLHRDDSWFDDVVAMTQI